MTAGITVTPGWLVDSKTGCKLYSTNITGRSVSWDGDCKDGYAQGIGKYIFVKNGKKESEITGTMMNGKLKGPGIIEMSNGSKYEGEFNYGEINGLGVVTNANGSRVEGKWLNNRLISEEKVDVQTIRKLVNARMAFRELQVQATNLKNLPSCPTQDASRKEEFGPNGKTWKFDNCWGTHFTNSYLTGDRYTGEFRNGYLHGKVILERSGEIYIGELKFLDYLSLSMSKGFRNGKGILLKANGDRYEGEFKLDEFDGSGMLTSLDGFVQDGIWKDGKFISSTTARSAKPSESGSFQKPADARRRLQLNISNTLPSLEGDFVISVQTNADTASLTINGEEFGGRIDGLYTIRKVARAGQESTFEIVAKDTSGNTARKSIVVMRQIASSIAKYANLNPTAIKQHPSNESIAIIIGISNYKRAPKAEYSNEDARDFYDYAIRALGIKPENIKLLIDDQAEDIEILNTFQSWLPAKVIKGKSDVYVFYSGHGLPSDDGKSLYFLPYGSDRQFLDRTAISQQLIVSALQKAQARSVTMFIDACYSGQSRTGETLLASARPLSIKFQASGFPLEFTVFSASAPDQIASSSPELKHGIFSYFLMKGMEGDADGNKDGKITATELQGYIEEMVGRQAMTMSRRQQPQMMGDASRVLVGR
jgi:hypothetical protein